MLVHLASNVVLKARKCLLAAGYRNLKKLSKLEISSHCLTHSLTTVASLEPKRSSARSPFYTTTTNSPMGCAFWGSGKCTPCAPCLLFIFNQAACLLVHPMKPYRGVNFPYHTFFKQHNRRHKII